MKKGDNLICFHQMHYDNLICLHQMHYQKLHLRIQRSRSTSTLLKLLGRKDYYTHNKLYTAMYNNNICLYYFLIIKEKTNIIIMLPLYCFTYKYNIFFIIKNILSFQKNIFIKVKNQKSITGYIFLINYTEKVMYHLNIYCVIIQCSKYII